jgi:polysaccharide biosynthesis protein PslG
VTSRLRIHLTAAVAAGISLALVVPNGPAQAFDPVGVARMQVCTPPTENFVSLEAAPEVEGPIPLGAGMHRLWDLGVAWKDVNPSQGVFNWSVLDAEVAQVEASGSKPMLVLGLTPQWAATDPNAGDPRWGLGTASPPREVAFWRDYVTAVVDRYGPRIAAYEIWNEVNLRTFWVGTPQQMSELTAEAFSIIKARQPSATVVTPSVTTRLRGPMRNFMRPFLVDMRERGFPFDVFSIHAYPAGDRGPEQRVEDVIYWQGIVVEQLGADSPILDRPVWDTEVNYGLAGPGPRPGQSFSDAQGADLIAQSFVDSQRLGIDATFWYMYTANNFPLLGVQLWQGTPISLARWEQLRRVFAPGSPCGPVGPTGDRFQTDAQLAFVAAGASATVNSAVVTDDGAPKSLSQPPAVSGSTVAVNDGTWSISVTRGSDFLIEGRGYAPNSVGYVWIAAPATFAAYVTTNAAGNFSVRAPLPAGVSPGSVVVQANVFLPDGKVRSSSIGLRSGGTAPGNQGSQASTSTLRQTVQFTGRSAKLTAASKRALRRFAAEVPKGTSVTGRITAAVNRNDRTRSAQRLARQRTGVVAAFLKQRGLTSQLQANTVRLKTTKKKRLQQVRVVVRS